MMVINPGFEVWHINAEDPFLENKVNAEIAICKRKLIIKNYCNMRIQEQIKIDSWKQIVDSIKIDFDYRGVFSPTIIDMPEKNVMVKGIYPIPKTAGKILMVKIVDILFESIYIKIEEEVK